MVLSAKTHFVLSDRPIGLLRSQLVQETFLAFYISLNRSKNHAAQIRMTFNNKIHNKSQSSFLKARSQFNYVIIEYKNFQTLYIILYV